MTDIIEILDDIGARNPEAATRMNWMASMYLRHQCIIIEHSTYDHLLQMRIEKGSGVDRDVAEFVLISKQTGEYVFLPEAGLPRKKITAAGWKALGKAPPPDDGQQELF